MKADEAKQLTDKAVEVLGLDLKGVYSRIMETAVSGKLNVILMIKPSLKDEILSQLRKDGYTVQLPIAVGNFVNIYWN